MKMCTTSTTGITTNRLYIVDISIRITALDTVVTTVGMSCIAIHSVRITEAGAIR